MALINCPECGSDVSDQAESCPSCGHPLESEQITNTNAPTTENKHPIQISYSIFEEKWPEIESLSRQEKTDAEKFKDKPAEYIERVTEKFEEFENRNTKIEESMSQLEELWTINPEKISEEERETIRNETKKLIGYIRTNYWDLQALENFDPPSSLEDSHEKIISSLGKYFSSFKKLKDDLKSISGNSNALNSIDSINNFISEETLTQFDQSSKLLDETNDILREEQQDLINEVGSRAFKSSFKQGFKAGCLIMFIIFLFFFIMALGD